MIRSNPEGKAALIRRFEAVGELHLALLEFKDTYYREYVIGLHEYKTPTAVRTIQIEAAT